MGVFHDHASGRGAVLGSRRTRPAVRCGVAFGWDGFGCRPGAVSTGTRAGDGDSDPPCERRRSGIEPSTTLVRVGHPGSRRGSDAARVAGLYLVNTGSLGKRPPDFGALFTK